ncbi:uncharacterized protein EI90DRAFT_2483161 [Cantharellus anzutake]|uniref:uncharacterized protein n=1 Tax=Cantharellus anzutake TaxID=1750568 RepID=UPI00190542C7|nr:uncharacterized protein EI90DRAFT_2483161 [Cantharellus anzutake]KAF8322370.1 hypothetical protein EI90DRAFT_2483161 [Cantharellus anzutake]
MDDFVVWHPHRGYVDSNLLSYFTSRFVSMSHHALSVTPEFCLPNPNFPSCASFPYVRSNAGYSAAVQLYLRSGQLHSNSLMFFRGLSRSGRCRNGCNLRIICSVFALFSRLIECPLWLTSRVCHKRFWRTSLNLFVVGCVTQFLHSYLMTPLYPGRMEGIVGFWAIHRY